jgi:hypothetical protein
MTSRRRYTLTPKALYYATEELNVANAIAQEHYCWRLAHNVTKGNIRKQYSSHFITYNYELYIL